MTEIDRPGWREPNFSVHDQEGYVPEYDEDEIVQIRKGDLRALLDLYTGSMDYGSGFTTEEQTEVLRKSAVLLGIDPDAVTQLNFICKYRGRHTTARWMGGKWRCVDCTYDFGDTPPPNMEYEGGSLERYQGLKPYQGRWVES